MIKAVLFDLDSTLLQMDQTIFLKRYMQTLGQKANTYFGYDPLKFAEDVMHSTYEMIHNDGSRLNEEVFWQSFQKKYPNPKLEAFFESFYYKDFKQIADVAIYNPLSKQAVQIVKEKGYKTILATNPIFPLIATKERMRWAGIEASDFDYITTYENSRYCKPSNEYYLEICEKNGLKPEECLMIGNDLADDFKFLSAEFQKYLVLDFLINTENAEIAMQSGTLADLIEFLKTI